MLFEHSSWYWNAENHKVHIKSISVEGLFTLADNMKHIFDEDTDMYLFPSNKRSINDKIAYNNVYTEVYTKYDWNSNATAFDNEKSETPFI